MMAPRFRLGFDIGGTFTDYVLLDCESGHVHVHKSLTNAADPACGAMDGLLAFFARLGIDGGAVNAAIHATTLITNALIERKGAKTALVTTAGFRDVLEMGTELRYDVYNLRAGRPEPLVPRPLRLEVRERIDRDGDVVTALCAEDVARVAEALRAEGVEAVAVTLLHAYREPAHEQAVRDGLLRAMPDLCVSLSSEVSPEIREYERMSTTVVNAYTQPISRHYLGRLATMLRECGCQEPLRLMVSSGGIAGAEAVVDHPIRLLESGPAAGVLAAVHDSQTFGIPDLITFDMGGTTAKIAVIKGHEAARATHFEAARAARFKKGSGLPIRLPVVELIEIGAGGGSIARIDPLGLIAVGPDSAASQPGPACYGRGGTEPTVTDANLVLGYLSTDSFLGGQMRLDMAAARRALDDTFGPLGKTAEEAARGIYEIVNQSMVSAARVHVAERCEDPRRFWLYAFGGAGPAHGYEIARALGMKGVIVPAAAGTGSAMGLVTSPVSFELARSHPAMLDAAHWPVIESVWQSLRQEAAPLLRKTGIADDSTEISYEFSMDLRHAGQGHELTVRAPEGARPEEIAQIFYTLHRRRFGHAHTHLPVELVTSRLSVIGPGVEHATVSRSMAEADGAPAGARSRRVYHSEAGAFLETRVLRRREVPTDEPIMGPAIIEEDEFTIVAGPSAAIHADHNGNIFLALTGGEKAGQGALAEEACP